MHAKTLQVDDQLIVGSTNWTTASRGNLETSVLIKLRPEGRHKHVHHFLQYWENATPLEDADISAVREHLLRRQRSASRSASSSEARRG